MKSICGCAPDALVNCSGTRPGPPRSLSFAARFLSTALQRIARSTRWAIPCACIHTSKAYGTNGYRVRSPERAEGACSAGFSPKHVLAQRHRRGLVIGALVHEARRSSWPRYRRSSATRNLWKSGHHDLESFWIFETSGPHAMERTETLGEALANRAHARAFVGLTVHSLLHWSTVNCP